jgi:hypothetical protein
MLKNYKTSCKINATEESHIFNGMFIGIIVKRLEEDRRLYNPQTIDFTDLEDVTNIFKNMFYMYDKKILVRNFSTMNYTSLTYP